MAAPPEPQSDTEPEPDFGPTAAAGPEADFGRTVMVDPDPEPDTGFGRTVTVDPEGDFGRTVTVDSGPEPEPDFGRTVTVDPHPDPDSDPDPDPDSDLGRTVTAGPMPSRTGSGRADRRRLARKIKRRRQRSVLKEIPLLIGVAVVIALILKTFLVQAFVIPSGSMEQTIQIGDRVLVDKLTPWFGAEPERGDVVVFEDPGHWLDQETGHKANDPVVVKQVKQVLTFIGLLPSDSERDLIKRVIAIGGDTVKCCDSQGRVTVNGSALNEPYLHPGNKPSEFKFTVTVPAGRLFVMGDHRANSADSRYHRNEPYGGTVSVDQVVGRARVVAWPVGHWRSLDQPGTYASIPDARDASAAATGTSHRVAPADPNGMIPLPTPAELPLVMGVVGLYRTRDRRRHGVRSECGGCGGRRTVRFRGPRGPAEELPWACACPRTLGRLRWAVVRCAVQRQGGVRAVRSGSGRHDG